MDNGTFYRISKEINVFVEKILYTNPDYIVPVKKKGCKLLKYTKKFSGELSEKIKYKDFFDNSNISLKNKRIAVVDDASKYTSMLYSYRNYFEEKGATVDTFSYVGHEKLRSGEREQYDPKAYIHVYLEESTYQEYLNQQSSVLVSDSNFFDIDHLVVKINMLTEQYDIFLDSLSKIGEIEFVNDESTPEYIEKISIINIDFFGAESLFCQGISQGALQKIRIVYNSSTEEMFIAPLSFPNWDSKKGDNESIFINVPFMVPYECNNSITKEGIYFNIVYVFQLSLLKFFFDSIKTYFDISQFDILDWDLKAYIGGHRACYVIKTAYDFLCSTFVFDNKKNKNRENVIVPRKASTPFLTISDFMSELRDHYNSLVSGAKTLVGVRYFLAYEEIIERYQGNENIIKWIDILCDRGVLVTRNYYENGIFYRACRSGESSFDLQEKKSGAIVVTATNACGSIYSDKKGRFFCSIPATYLNKVLANFVYDYPSNYYCCHRLYSQPYNYGPLVYIQDKIDGNTALSLYAIDKITNYCSYDRTQKKFIAVSNKNIDVKGELSERLGQHDDIPFTELTAYLGFLKYIKEENGTDNFLNALAICREQDTYFKHIFYNIREAYRNMIMAKQNEIGNSAENLLRQAATLANSAQTKLSYEQSKVRGFIAELKPDMVYEQAQQKIIDSFILFEENFCKEILPVLHQIANIEFLLVNVMLFHCTSDTKYWKKMYNKYLKQDDIQNADIEMINSMMCVYSKWDNEQYVHYINFYNQMTESCANEINNRILFLHESGYVKSNGIEKNKNKKRAVNNVCHYIEKNRCKNVLILYYTYSGYDNINDEKEVDVVKKVQEIVTTKSEGGRLIYGAEEDDYGLYVTDSLEKAVDFANKLLQIMGKLSNVFFRFGCGYRMLNSVNYKKSVEEALSDAQYSANKVKNRNVFIISKLSYLNMKNIENEEHMNFLEKLYRNSDEYYEYVGIDLMNRKVKRYDVNTDERIKIGIITVLTEEHSSMRAMLENKQYVQFPGRGSGNQFILGDIESTSGEIHKVALARTIGDNNNKAAIRAAKLLEHFPNLEVIFMVGIAGGTPVLPGVYDDDPLNHLDKHVRLGDIVVSKGIFQYDYVKEKIDNFIFKGDNIPPCSKVVEAQQRLEEFLEFKDDDVAPWNIYVEKALEQLKSNYMRPDNSTDILRDCNGVPIEHLVDEGRNNKYPRIFNGKIASSNTVLKNPEKRDLLKKEHDVYAIEMETSGIADTTWEAGIGYYGVRGICDYCDSYKNDIWHRYAALVAAAYTKALIEQM